MKQKHTVLVNGESSDVSPSDRGLAYGDGAFETMRYVDSHVPLLDRHLARLDAACDMLGIEAPGHNMWTEDIRSITADETESSCVIKLIVTRGTGGFGYAPPRQQRTTRIATRLALPAPDEDDGLRADLLNTRLGSNRQLAGVKHLSRLEQVLAAREMQARGLQEGLVCNESGFVIEAVSSNVMFVFGDRVVTPRLDAAGVRGVMRDLLIEAMAQTRWSVKEDFVHGDAVTQADEIILCNSVRGVRRIGRLGNQVLEPRAVFDVLKKRAEAAFKGRG